MRLSRCALRTAPGTLEALVLLARTGTNITSPVSNRVTCARGELETVPSVTVFTGCTVPTLNGVTRHHPGRVSSRTICGHLFEQQELATC